jgi:hypothetical protein
VRAFGDSQLVVQQVLEEYQCFDGTQTVTLKNVGIIHSFDEFSIGTSLELRITELTIWHKMHQVIG